MQNCPECNSPMHNTSGCPICPSCGYSKCDGVAMPGKKHDLGKTRYDLLPPISLDIVAQVLTGGSKKYSDDNWRKVPDLKKRYFAAAQRHLWAWKRGEENDTEWNLHHLAHAICCIMFILEYIKMEKDETV